jgi:predicted dinucleotide-utilizing enzyme
MPSPPTESWFAIRIKESFATQSGEERKWPAEGQDGAFEPLRIFEGTPREAAIGFPANLNVAVALSLAGIGADRMTLEMWAPQQPVGNLIRLAREAESRNASAL